MNEWIYWILNGNWRGKEKKTECGAGKEGGREGGSDEEGVDEYKWLSVWVSALVGNRINELICDCMSV